MPETFVPGIEPGQWLVVGLISAYVCLALFVMVSWLSSRAATKERQRLAKLHHQSRVAASRTAALGTTANETVDENPPKETHVPMAKAEDVDALRTEIKMWAQLLTRDAKTARKTTIEIEHLRCRVETLESELAEHRRAVSEKSARENSAADSSRLNLYDPADDLTQIWGIGAVNQTRLNENGVFRFHQIAAWTPEMIEHFDHLLGFKGRIAREGWVDQAQRLATVSSRRVA